MKFDDKALIAAKIAFFVYIVLSPFINHKPIAFLNSLLAKITLLVIIVGVSFVDLQLAIVMTLAFLILIINLNKEVIFGIKSAPTMYPGTGLSEHFAVGLPREVLASDTRTPPYTDTMSEFPDSTTDRCDALKANRDQVSKDLYDLYIDPKIKPYEMYIRALSHPDALDNAAESAVLGMV